MNLDEFDKEETMKEASYKYNIGFQEMVSFYQKASSSEIKQMEKFVMNNNWNGFKSLIRKVLNIELKG